MPTPAARADSPLPPRARRRLEAWLRRWEVPGLVHRLEVEFSPRLTRAFGRCYLDRALIRLTPSLAGRQAHLLPEILCHEAAHAAVHELYGPDARPHGEEWEALMRAAGFEPRVRIPVVVRRERARPSQTRPVYEHRCPTCRVSRQARRPMHGWRCRTCASTRTGGHLVIRRSVARRPSRVASAAPIGQTRRPWK